MAKKKDDVQTDVDTSGPNVQRFVDAPGFAQRRPKAEKKEPENAVDDNADGQIVADGDKPRTTT